MNQPSLIYSCYNDEPVETEYLTRNFDNFDHRISWTMQTIKTSFFIKVNWFRNGFPARGVSRDWSSKKVSIDRYFSIDFRFTFENGTRVSPWNIRRPNLRCSGCGPDEALAANPAVGFTPRTCKTFGSRTILLTRLNYQSPSTFTIIPIALNLIQPNLVPHTISIQS